MSNDGFSGLVSVKLIGLQIIIWHFFLIRIPETQISRCWAENLLCAAPSSLSLFLTDYSMDCCSPTNFSSKVWERPTEIPLQKFIQTFPFIRNINCTGKVVGSWVARQKPSSLFFTWNFVVETKSLEIKIVWDEQSFSPDNWY